MLNRHAMNGMIQKHQELFEHTRKTRPDLAKLSDVELKTMLIEEAAKWLNQEVGVQNELAEAALREHLKQ